MTIISIASTLVLASAAAYAADSHERGAGMGNRSLGVSTHDAGFLFGDPESSDTPASPALSPIAASQVSDAWTDHTIRHWRGGPIDIVPLRDLGESGMTAELKLRAREPGEAAALKSAIEHNRKLETRLEARNVAIRKVVGAETSTDGAITFFVR